MNDNKQYLSEELGKYYWFQSYFRKHDSIFYKRDFNELHFRDIALMTLGQIEGRKILDIGCGTGLYTLTFLKLGAKTVCAQDISKDAIEETIRFCKSEDYSNFEFKIGDCQEMQFEDNSFDLAFSGNVFEHINYQTKVNFINEVYRVLMPGGKFTIKTPNKDYLRMTNLLRRIQAMLKLKNPFKIHIAHTRNNPDNEHHGLSTYKEMKNIFSKTMFHEPVITYKRLNKKMIPGFISKLFMKSKYFNAQIIITVTKPVFFGLYN